MSLEDESGRTTVLHLIDTDGPGGAETIFVALASGLQKRGWRSVAVVTDRGWSAQELERRGIEPKIVPSRGGWDVAHLRRLWTLIGRENVDLVQTHLLGPAVYGSVAACFRGVPSVATLHGSWDLRNPGSLPGLKQLVLGACLDVAVLVSAPLSSEVEREAFVRSGRTAVIPNGIDVSEFHAVEGDGIRAELGVGAEDFLVGTVGNLRPAKSHRSFLELAARLRARDESYRFVVVGEASGESIREMRRLRAELSLEDRLVFTGYRDDVERIMASLDVFALTSTSEGFSLTTVEAMASGLPVVATRCGGPEEIVDDGRTGFLVDVEDMDAMARRIEELRLSPASRTQVGEAARQHVEREYSRDRMIDSYVSLYRDVLGERPVGDAG